MSEGYRLEIRIPALPDLQGNRSSRHWRFVRAHDREWHGLVRWAIGSRKPTAPLSRASLCATRKSAAEPDYDNLVFSFKPLVDALVLYGVLEDDSMSVLVDREYRWEKAVRGRGSVVVVIEEASA